MPRNETILSIFVASPDDVPEERDRVDSVVNEINSTNARRMGIRLEVLRWERDVAAAAIKEDVQAVVNDQIPQDHDVYLGIFWHKIGSPTSRSESGTVEEYERAKARFEHDPNSVHLMLYFKDAPPLNMDKFDPDQYKKVMAFRKRVEKEVLYRVFGDADSFANTIRSDLTKLTYDMASASASAVGIAGRQLGGGGEASEVGDDEDEGYLDLLESFEEETDSLNSTLYRMSDAIADIGSKFIKMTEELTTLKSSIEGRDLSTNEIKRYRSQLQQVFRRSSKEMESFTKRIRHDIPLFRRHLDKSVSAFTKAAPIYLDLNKGEDKDGWSDVITSLLNAMTDMLKSMEGFRDSVDTLPRVATSLNRIKRQTNRVLQEVVDVTRGGVTSLEAVLAILH